MPGALGDHAAGRGLALLRPLGAVLASGAESSWAAVSSPSPGRLAGVAAVSATGTGAAGSVTGINGITSTVIGQWTGTSWSTVPSPSPGGNVLAAVPADRVSTPGLGGRGIRQHRRFHPPGTHRGTTPERPAGCLPGPAPGGHPASRRPGFSN